MHITKKNIDEFIEGTTMYGSNMYITGIDYIPDHITHLYCDNNKLTELPKLPYSLRYFDCNNNKLTSLPKLPHFLKRLYCDNNNLPYTITIENLKEHNTLIKRKEILSKICV